MSQQTGQLTRAERKSIVTLAMLKTFLILSGALIEEVKNEGIKLIEEAMEVYDGELNDDEMKEIENRLAHIFDKMFQSKYEITNDFICSLIIYFSERALDFLKNPAKRSAWEKVNTFGHSNVGKYEKSFIESDELFKYSVDILNFEGRIKPLEEMRGDRKIDYKAEFDILLKNFIEEHHKVPNTMKLGYNIIRQLESSKALVQKRKNLYKYKYGFNTILIKRDFRPNWKEVID
jgi:hypothetical protein